MSVWALGGGFLQVFDMAETAPVTNAALAASIATIKAKTDSLTFTVAGQVDANIQYVNDVLVNGNGAGTPWGP